MSTSASVDRDGLASAYLALRADVRAFVARRVAPDAVDDLTQEIFLKMHEHAAELRDASKVAPWLFRVARNVVVDHLRRRRAHTPLEAVEEPAAPEPEERANANPEMASALGTMMKLLPEEYRVALELTEMSGLTQRELAEREGLSLSGAKSRVQRGRQLLEGILRACCDFETDARGNVVDCAPRAGGPCKSC